MTTLIIIVILILCFVLGFFILVQQPKGGGLSGAFGSMGAQVMGVQKSGDAMEKGTWYTMALIALLSIASVFTLDIVKPTPVQQQQQQQEQQAIPSAGEQSLPTESAPLQPTE